MAPQRKALSLRVCRGGRLCPPVSLVRNDRGVGLSTRKQRPAFRPPGIRKHTPQKARFAQPRRCAALTDIQYACGGAPRLCTKRALFRCEAVLPKYIRAEIGCKNARMLTHVGVFSVDFSRIDTGKTVCFLVSGGLCAGRWSHFNSFRVSRCRSGGR